MKSNFPQLIFEANAEHFLRDNAAAILRGAPQDQRGVVVAAQCPDGTVNMRWLPTAGLLACVNGPNDDGMKPIAAALLEQSMAINLEAELLVAVTVQGRWWIGVLGFEPNPPEPNQIAV
jgi:hypothetical protein